MNHSTGRRRFLQVASAAPFLAMPMARPVRAGTKEPSETLIVGIMGTGGRGTEPRPEFRRPAGRRGRLRVRRRPAPRGQGGRRSRPHGQEGTEGGGRLPPHPRRQGGRRPGRRHVQSLARAGRHPRLRRRQARLCREAVQPQPARGRAAGRGRPQAQPRRADGQPAPQLAARSSRPSSRSATAPSAGAYLAQCWYTATSRRRSATARRCRCPSWLDYELWQGPAARQAVPRQLSSTTTGTGSGTGATASSATTAST